MARRKKKSTSIRLKSQIEVLASPARQEILDLLAANGPSSITEIGALLGRASDSLYYHMKQLRQAKLIIQVDVRPSKRREEAVYDVPPGLSLAESLADPENHEAMERTLRSLLRLTERDFVQAMRAEDTVLSGTRRNLWGGRQKAWLSAKELQEVRKRLAEVDEIMSRAPRTPTSQLYSVTYIVTPIKPRVRERKRSGDDE